MSRMDLHSFLEKYKGDYIEINKPVKLEQVGALVAEADDTILFNKLEGYPSFKLIDQLFVNRKAQSHILGCDPKDVVKALSEVLKRGPKPLKNVDGGPCQEIVYKGEDVDLSMLPIVTHTPLDAYPYATSFVVHRDLETGEYNQMYPRSGVLGKNEMVTSYVTPTAANMLAKYKAAGKKMPQTMVIGAHPAWELAGCYSYTHEGWWEMELFESITGVPGEVTKCITNDLIVPADASIIIEGFVDPNRLTQDGPNPGPTMLYTPYIQQQPVFEVTAITMRKDPIYRHHQTTPFTDHQEMPRIFHEAIIYDRLRSMGFKIHDVYIPNGGAALSVIIQAEPTMDGQITDALLCALGSPWSNIKMAIAVDPDINIYDYRDVYYALATRVDPSKHVIIVNNGRAFPFDPSGTPIIGAFPHTEQSRLPSIVGKWGIDATKPVPYRAKERKVFERAWPIGWGEIKLKDFLD